MTFGLHHFLVYTTFYVWSTPLFDGSIPLFGLHQILPKLLYTTFWSIPLFTITIIWCRPKYGIDQTPFCGLYHFLQQHFGIDQLLCANNSGIDQKLVQTKVLKSGIDLKNGVDQKSSCSYLRETRGNSRLRRFFYAIFHPSSAFWYLFSNCIQTFMCFLKMVSEQTKIKVVQTF